MLEMLCAVLVSLSCYHTTLLEVLPVVSHLTLPYSIISLVQFCIFALLQIGLQSFHHFAFIVVFIVKSITIMETGFYLHPPCAMVHTLIK